MVRVRTLLASSVAVAAMTSACLAETPNLTNVSQAYLRSRSHNERIYDHRTGATWVVVNTLTTKGLYITRTRNGREVRYKHGVFYSYRSTGSLYQTMTYDMGVKAGPAIAYHSNGKVRSEVSYRKGQKHGKLVEYNDRGVKTRQKMYVNGARHGKDYKYDRRGRLHFETDYENNEIHGQVLQYDTKTGELVARSRYENGNRIGKIEFLR